MHGPPSRSAEPGHDPGTGRSQRVAQAAPTAPPATPEAEQAWVDHNVEVGDATLFPTADSWCMGSNGEDEPRVFMPYIGGVGGSPQHG